MNKLKDIELLKNNIISLKEASYDDNNNGYMTNLIYEVFDFDIVKRKYLNELGFTEEKAKSVDAILNYDKDYIFIEFKNGKMKNKKNEVKEKLKDSLLIFCDITNKTISYTRKNCEFILVYNESKNNNSKEYIQDRTFSLSKKEIVRFDLEKYIGVFFRNIHTYTEKEFESYIEKLKVKGDLDE